MATFYGKYAGILGGGAGGGGGVTSLNGETGAVNLVAGTNITITPAGQNITIDATGGGDVVGPASSTDNAVVRFDGVTGKLIQNSGVTIDDSNNIVTPGLMTAAQYTASSGDTLTPSFYVPTGSGNTGFFFGAGGGTFSYNGGDIASFVGTQWKMNVAENLFVNSSAGQPALYLLGENTTGLFRVGANNLGFSISSVKILDINSGGLGVTGTLTADQIIDNGLTADTVPYANSSKQLTSSAVTPTELGYVSGVTSSIQTQLNGKQASLTIGDLTDAGTDGITVTGGIGSVIGTGTSLSQHVADATHNGYLSSTDWSTFNSKGSGTVTAVSVATTNGFAGSSSGGATPALTLSTTITGILSGNGTAISAASTTGSGNVVLATSPTITTPTIAKLANLTTNGFVKTSGGDGTLGVQTSPIPAADIGLLRTINTQSGTTYTAALADGSGAGANTQIQFTSGSAVTFTIPTNASVAFPTGTQIDFSQEGAGKVTVAAAGGVTINSLGGNLSLAGQYVAGCLVKNATNTWTLYGNLIA